MASLVRRGPATAQTRLLAAIHLWAFERQPRVRVVLPARARTGEPVIALGRGFGEGILEARFGRVATWAVAVSDGVAVAIVPPGAGPRLALFRRALASPGGLDASAGGGGPTRVQRVDPADGALGVLRDTPVVVGFSRPLARDPEAPALRVSCCGRDVAGRTRRSPDGRVLVWGGERPLAPEALHAVEARGLRDRRGEPVEEHESAFATGALTLRDVLVTP